MFLCDDDVIDEEIEEGDDEDQEGREDDPDWAWGPKIYGLGDPEYKNIGYIGYTDRPLATRLVEHIHEAKEGKGSRRKQEWLEDIRLNGQRPFIVEFPWPPHMGLTQWEEAERYWIKLFRDMGANLVNEADGGLGQHGTTHSEADIIKISEGMKAAHARKRQQAPTAIMLSRTLNENDSK